MPFINRCGVSGGGGSEEILFFEGEFVAAAHDSSGDGVSLSYAGSVSIYLENFSEIYNALGTPHGLTLRAKTIPSKENYAITQAVWERNGDNSVNYCMMGKNGSYLHGVINGTGSTNYLRFIQSSKKLSAIKDHSNYKLIEGETYYYRIW